MKDCTTCQYCQSCDEYFSCELHDEVWESAKDYIGHDCDEYKESTAFVLTQVWDWRNR